MGSPSPKLERLVVSGRYHIQRKLGSGSMGSVYLARDEATSSLVALKVVKTDRLGPEGLADLQREFRDIADLRHPQIAAAYDFGYTTGARIPFYTREYIAGTPLRPGPPGQEGQLSPRDFLQPFYDLLDALHYLHAQEILHLDIHAGNVIEADDDERGSVLIDFGLVGALRGSGTSALLKSGKS